MSNVDPNATSDPNQPHAAGDQATPPAPTTTTTAATIADQPDQAAPPAPSTPPSDQPSTPPASSPSSSIDVLGASAQVAKIQAAQNAAPEPPPAPALNFPQWNEGQLVRHRWSDPYGDKEAYGLVLNVLHDDGVEDRVEVLWISTNRSGPIAASEFEDPADDK